MSDVSPLRLAIFNSRQTQKAIAEKAGIHPVTLSRIVGGGSSDQDTKRKIARALGRTAEELFGEPGREAA